MSDTSRKVMLGAVLLAVIIFGAARYAQAMYTERRLLQQPPTAEPLVPTRLPSYRQAPAVSMTRTTASVVPTQLSSTVPPVTQEVVSAPTARLPLLTPDAIRTARVSSSPVPSTTTSSSSHPTAPAKAASKVALVGASATPPGTALVQARARVCAGLPSGALGDYDWQGGLPGWYLNWRVVRQPDEPGGTRFAQMPHVTNNGFYPALKEITTTAAANPGALWLIGNEPDVVWQDNATPEQYATGYGALYQAIKATDPTAQVAIGGVSQPTGLRMAYLDRILAAYRARFRTEMPVDAWNIHAFVLREEKDSWGVGIPPGMEVEKGQITEISDHADLGILRRQIAEFRRWMADRGLRDKPLIVSEYGILMPDSYGFPPEVVSRFLTESFDFFLNARDPDTGYPVDDNRLVQAFCWYSTADTTYPTPNLFDPQSRAVTPVGLVFRDYVAGLR